MTAWPVTAWTTHWSQRRDTFAAECREQRDRFLDDLRAPRAAQARIFEDMLATFSGSLHWEREGFDKNVVTVDDFRHRLPIRRYDDFAPLIEEETRTKGGVLSCSPVLRWLKTSGTTGSPKRVPYTLHWVDRYRVPAIQAMWGTYLHYHPEILEHPHATLDTQTVREDVSDYVHGVEFQAISNRHPPVHERDWSPPWYDAPWFGPTVPSAHERRMYHRLRHMIGQKLRYISSINPSTLISMRDILVAQRESLARDIFDGTLDGRVIAPPDPETARHFMAVMEASDLPDLSLKAVWPSLSLYSCWMTSSAGLYRSKLNAIFPGVDCLPFMSCGTEGVVTIPIDPTTDSQPLAVNQAFFEFIPADEDLEEILAKRAPADTLLAHEVEAGRDYHMIMTQGNGLYRLATGDIYHVNDMVGGVPWIQFIRRDGLFHSFTGEKITEIQFSQAVTQAFQDLGFDMGLYFCGPRWGDPPNYVVLVETTRHEHADTIIAGAIDRKLSEINIEYASKRDSDRLAPIEVVTVPHAAIDAYLDGKRRLGNATQYKYKPFQKDTDFLNDFIARAPAKAALRGGLAHV